MPHREKGGPKTKARKPGKTGPYSLRGRIWVDGPSGTFIGCGRVVLMERIREHGSITRAAKSMNMSYRNAWRLIDSMNRQAPRPFVVTATGGKNGGGAYVTEHGERAIRMFWKTHDALRRFLEREGLRLDFREVGP